MMARPDYTGASQHKSLRPETGTAGRVLELIRRNQGVLGLIILVALSSLPIGFHLGKARVSLYSPYFWQWANFANIFRQTSITGILAVGMTFVIITGGIELSVGSGLAFLGCVAALLAKSDRLPFAMLISITVCLGAVIGGINGALVTRGKFQPFIATLAAMVTLRGLAFRITDSNIVTGPNFASKFGGFSSNVFLPIPAPLGHLLGTDQFWNPVPVFAIIFLIAVIVGQVLLVKSRFGRQVMSVGGNEEATRLSGVSVDRTKILVYAINGIMVGLAALMFTARTSTGDPASGLGYELDAIAAAVVGGTSLMGGKGSIVGTLIGALFIGVLNNSLQLNSIDRYTALALEGPIILLAVGLQRRR
jgi:ribose transport system permease protein